MLVYVFAIPIFVFLGVSSTEVARPACCRSTVRASVQFVGTVPARPGSSRRPLAASSATTPRSLTYRLRPRPRQPRHPDRHVEPRTCSARVVAYPGHRDPRAHLSRRSRPLDGRTTKKSEGHALGGEGHLRAHGRPRLRLAVLRATSAWPTKSPSSRSGSTSSCTRCARCACSPAARSATPSRSRACCTSCPRSSAWATPRSTSSRIVTHRLGIPAALVADLAAAEEVSHRVRVRDGSRARGPPPRRRRAADGGRHARRRAPARSRVDHRPRRRRPPAPRRRADPARRARRHRRGARARRRARVACRRRSRRTRRSPTSTAPSTCSSR